jgi:hypothetical protein
MAWMPAYLALHNLLVISMVGGQSSQNSIALALQKLCSSMGGSAHRYRIYSSIFLISMALPMQHMVYISANMSLLAVAFLHCVLWTAHCMSQLGEYFFFFNVRPAMLFSH